MDVRTYRKIHRWLGLVIGIQLVLWTASGLFFSLNPIAKVRGETEAPEPQPIEAELPVASPAAAISQLISGSTDIEIQTVLLRPHLESAVYEISYLKNGEPRWALADGATGELQPSVDRDEALEIARKSYLPDSAIADIILITDTAIGSEYRDQPLPAFRITFDDPLGTRLYVSTERGVVTARRNDRWRWFDLLWMLHIMDYQTRDNFNTLLLQVVSALGLVTVLSGFALFAITSPRLRRLAWRR
jgi:hypothetical protein